MRLWQNVDHSAGKDNRRLSTSHTTCLKRIMPVFWPSKIYNARLLQATGWEPMGTILRRRMWEWLGHVLRMEPTAHTRTALTWTPEGRGKRGRPRTTCRKTVMEEIRSAGIGWERVTTRIAQDRVIWRDLVKVLCATGHFEIE